MSKRHNVQLVSIPKGTIYSEDCNGVPTLYVSSQNNCGFVYTAYSKSAIVKSDKFKPTAYRNYWVNKCQVGKYGYSFTNVVCEKFHPTLPARPLTAKATGMPYYPTNYYFGLYGAITDFAYSPDQRLTPNSKFAKVRTLCEMEVLKKLKSQKMAAPVSIAEGKQTFSLAMDLTKDLASTVLHIARGISNPRSLVTQFHKIVDKYGFKKRPPIPRKKKALRKFHNAMYDAFKRRKIHYPNSIPSDVTSRWLQYRYGIVPLMGDVEALHDIFYLHALEPFFSSITAVRYRTKQEFQVGGAGSDGLNIMTVAGTSKMVAEVKLYFKNGRQGQITARRLGTSLRDMPATLWELVPFSFVVDWFIDFGDYFSALSASYGLTFVQGYFAVKESVRDETLLYEPFSGQVTPRATENGEENKAIREYGVFNRTLYNSFPIPTLPSFEFPYSSMMDKRLADTISLFVQLRRKGLVIN